jgi:adenine-specific DNA-methyltransferase
MPTLNWIGKDAVVNHHNQVPFRLLRVNPDLSVGDPDAGNLLVQGDNLLALKALLPYYAGQVKCIYIDPPYNTGTEKWIYNDNVNSPGIREWLGKVVGGQSEDLSRHDKWLCMMYPRLVLLKQFLRQDGVIIVAIDDNELAHLRSLMDEIFGAANWIATLIWEKTRKNDAKFFSIGHDYMVVFALDKAYLRGLGTVWRESKPGAGEILDKYEELRSAHGSNNRLVERQLREWYRSLPDSHPSKSLSRYKHVDDNGVWRDRDISWPGGGGPRYDVIHPVTGKPCRVPERGWGFATTEAMQDQIDLGLVEFRGDHTKPPIRKAYLRTGNANENDDSEGVAGAQVMPSVIYRHTQPSVRLLRRIMGRKAFNNPKDHEVLARLFRYVTSPGDMILDSFAGSGSTGHALLQINHEDMSNRRFILVEMEKDIAERVTAERLARVIQGYDYSGKEKRLLYATTLNISTLRHSAEIFQEINAVKKARKTEFAKFETKIEDGQIVLRGLETVVGKRPG